jgi:hypothetical protein
VAFGHRHQRSLSRINSIVLEEASNVATEDPHDFGFYLITKQPNSPPDVHWCEVTLERVKEYE